MATTNPVSQVLVTTGDQAILAAGSRPDALAVGQLGIFNYHTGLSVDGTVPGDCRDIFFAVGIDPDGIGSIQDVNRSAGQLIQVRNAKSLTAKAYISPLPKIIEIAGFIAKCETDYALKVEFRSQKSYSVNGYNQFSKTFNFFTGCCTEVDCAACPQGDCNELVVGMAANINADLDHLITASFFVNTILATINGAPTGDGNTVVTLGTQTFTVPVLDADTAAQTAAKIVAFVNSQTTSLYYGSAVGAAMTFYPKTTISGQTASFAVSGVGVTANAISTANANVTDTAAFIAANPGVCMGLRLTGGSDLLGAFNGSIPTKYFNPRGINFLVSLVEGFACNGTQTLIQDVRYEEGNGKDVQYEEYVDGGWNGRPGPYRVSSINGLQKDNITYFATATANYTLVRLTYDQMSVGGWLEYLNNLMTTIAIPCASTTTLQGFIAITDLIFTQFQPMTNDVAGMDCTNVPVHTINNPALDGIESLS